MRRDPIIVGFEITERDRRHVARFLGRPGERASNDEMRAFLAMHGTRGLETPASPLLSCAGVAGSACEAAASPPPTS